MKKRGYISVVYKVREVRKHFVVSNKITRQLIFYDIISIIEIYLAPSSKIKLLLELKTGTFLLFIGSIISILPSYLKMTLNTYECFVLFNLYIIIIFICTSSAIFKTSIWNRGVCSKLHDHVVNSQWLFAVENLVLIFGIKPFPVRIIHDYRFSVLCWVQKKEVKDSWAK